MDKNTEQSRQYWLWIFLATAFGLYAIVINGQPQFDDYHVFYDLSREQIWDRVLNLRRCVSHFTFALNFFFHGKWLPGYHLTNILIHALCAYGVFVLVRHLMQDRKQEFSYGLSAGFIFLCHPLATQSVAYISQRYSSLAAMFMIWSMIFYYRARKDLGNHPDKLQPSERKYSTAAVLCAILAMFCKEYAVALPLIILMMDFLYFRDGCSIKRRLAFLLPILATGLIIPLMYTDLLNSGSQTAASTNVTGLAAWGMGKVPRHEYLMSQWPIILEIYTFLLFIPVGQSIDHPYHIVRHISDLRALLALCGIIILFIIGLKGIKKNRDLSFGLWIIFISILPTSSLVPNTEFAAEHRSYFAICGATLIFIWLLSKLPEKAFFKVVIPLLLCFTALSVNRNYLWTDEILLWQDAAAKNDISPRPEFAIGHAYKRRGQFAEAEKHFKAALEIAGNYQPAQMNLGIVLEEQKKYKEALNVYIKSMKMFPKNTEAMENAGLVLLRFLDEPEKAALAFRQALAINANSLNAVYHLALAESRIDTPESKKSAMQHFRIVTSANPPVFMARQAHKYLAIELKKEGDIAQAEYEALKSHKAGKEKILNALSKANRKYSLAKKHLAIAIKLGVDDLKELEAALEDY